MQKCNKIEMKARINAILDEHNLTLENATAYVATAYTNRDGIEVEMRVLAATKIIIMLRDSGLCCYSPIVHWHPVHKISPAEYDYYLKNDLIMLRRFDILFVGLTPGINESSGLSKEYHLAKELNIPIYYITLEGEIFNGNYEPGEDDPFAIYIKQPE